MAAVQTAVPDRKFETRHADKVIEALEKGLVTGSSYVVLELRPMDTQLHPADLEFYKDKGEALDDWEMRSTGGYLPGDADHPVCFWQVDKLIPEIRLANPEIKEKQIKLPVNLRVEQKPRKRTKGRRL